jgi:tRNA threonylcarbamoyladenosine biosynthesis protein TsaE
MSKVIYESYSEEETKAIGIQIGKESLAQSIYCIEGDLGVGKTVLSKGFALGLEIEEHITSPTFTIVNVYESGIRPFYHFDVYRISDPYELDEIGYEDYFYGNGTTMIEWASLISDLIPNTAIYISIEKDLDKGLDYRKICVSTVGE